MLCSHPSEGFQEKHSSGSPHSQNKVQAQVSPSFSLQDNGFNLTAPNKPNFKKHLLKSPWKLVNALMKSLTALFACRLTGQSICYSPACKKSVRSPAPSCMHGYHPPPPLPIPPPHSLLSKTHQQDGRFIETIAASLSAPA